MRLVLALIQPTKLKAVQEALAKVGVERMTVCDALGYGQQRGLPLGDSAAAMPSLLRKVALEIAVNEDFLDRTIETISHVGRTGASGEIGDGKIFVLPIEEVVRLSDTVRVRRSRLVGYTLVQRARSSVMAMQHAQSGAVIDLSPLGSAVASTKTATLAKTVSLELIRLVLPAGKIIPEHKVPGEITVQCLEGQVDFTAAGKTQRLTAGKLLWLSGNEPHAVHAVTDASVLVTILLN